ncbi:MAG: hypothetical protein ACR2QH_07330 [Geminicoccaceae bacterium]
MDHPGSTGPLIAARIVLVVALINLLFLVAEGLINVFGVMEPFSLF